LSRNQESLLLGCHGQKEWFCGSPKIGGLYHLPLIWDWVIKERKANQFLWKVPEVSFELHHGTEGNSVQKPVNVALREDCSSGQMFQNVMKTNFWCKWLQKYKAQMSMALGCDRYYPIPLPHWRKMAIPTQYFQTFTFSTVHFCFPFFCLHASLSPSLLLKLPVKSNHQCYFCERN